MNPYEQKQADRKARLEAKADAARAEADQRFGAADRIASVIPFGQPVLVGHHSEKRHRRDLDRIDRNMRRGVEAIREAADLTRRATSVGTGGVSSDDPDAVAKLRAELTDLERTQTLMVATNKAVRGGDTAALFALGHSSAMVDMLTAPDAMGYRGYPPYKLTNNGASIRRLKARIAELETASTRATTETEFPGGARLVENAEANRVQIVFPGKPDEATRGLLKSRGFRWSPNEGAWQRHLNNAGVAAAREILGRLGQP